MVTHMNPTTYINPNTMPTIPQHNHFNVTTASTVHVDAQQAMNNDKLRYCKARNSLYLVSPVDNWPKTIFVEGRQEGATYIMDANNVPSSSVRKYILTSKIITPNAPNEMYVWHRHHADDMIKFWSNAILPLANQYDP